jgi:hypothetical protein
LYYFLLLWFKLYMELFVLQNTLYIVFHVICMLFTYANNLVRLHQVAVIIQLVHVSQDHVCRCEMAKWEGVRENRV